ncbi:MAG TPA: CPBP family intramembrane glutamic endopeptidase [Streptosporangiaceae bacterium]
MTAQARDPRPGRAGPPARRPRWWSVQAPPPVPAISARRAYGEVLLVFAAFFAAGIVAGGETLAGRYPVPSGSWAVFVPATLSELGLSVLAVLVVVLLSARRGMTARWLGLGWPRRPDGTPAGGQALRIGVWALTALMAGGVVTAALAMGHRLGQPAHQGAPYLVYAVGASITAGVVEETVVLAFVVSTLRQARRPLPEIVAVAVLLRCSYHDYYGLGVLGIVVWALVFIWLYLRGGSILPLIVVHVLWDASIFLGQRWHAIRVYGGEVYLLLVVAAALTWLAEVRSRHAQAPSAGGLTSPLPWGTPGPAPGSWPGPVPGPPSGPVRDPAPGPAPGPVPTPPADPPL